MNVIGPPGFVALSFLPGAWLAFGLPLAGVGLMARALLAVVLSPVLLLAQFYAVRLSGTPFPTTMWILLLGNLPAAWFVHRRWTDNRIGRARPTLLPHLLVWVIPAGLIVQRFHDLELNALRAHHFVHSDIVYAVARGGLLLEEPLLAGVTLGYPWGGHVPQAVLSWIWGTPPAANYIWTNIVLLLAGVGLIAMVTGKLGGSAAARALTVVWILFAVNAVGYALGNVLPDDLVARYPLWGDARYTPWLRKYLFWNQHPFGHGLYAAVLYLMVGERSEAFSRSGLVLLAVSLIGLGAIYPILLPAAAALPVARFASELYQRRRVDPVRLVQDTGIPLGAAVLAGGFAAVGTLAIIGEARIGGSGLALSSSWGLRTKSVETVIVLSPLLVGTAIVLASRRWGRPERWEVPFLGGIASAAMGILFMIPNGANEYKFMFPAAMSLAPLAAVGFERFRLSGTRTRLVINALVLLFLVGTGVHKLARESAAAHRQLRVVGPFPLDLELDHFGLRLARGQPLTAPLQAIARRTPPSTIVVVDSVGLHVSVFAGRALYAPPRTDDMLAGVGLRYPYMLEQLRAYGTERVRSRMEVVKRLFWTDEPAVRRASLEAVGRLERPVAVLMNLPRHAELLEVLLAFDAGDIVYHDGRSAVWLWRPGENTESSRPTDDELVPP